MSEQTVSVRVFGNFALGAADPEHTIINCAGTQNLTDPTRLHIWCGDLLLKSIKVRVTNGIMGGEQPIPGISTKMDPIEEALLRHVNMTLNQFGLQPFELLTSISA